METIKIKPLSSNRCWQGRRFKTQDYKDYEEELFYKLPKIKIPEGNLRLEIEVGYSNKVADIDNFAKPFIDILQKKYSFNDNRIYELFIIKTITKKGDEFIAFRILNN
jgi:Holliday junction resolvase RusA-like endonuclease